jgi:hypothetical protein
MIRHFAIATLFVSAASAQKLKCESVATKSATEVKIGVKTLKAYETGRDAAVNTACSPMQHGSDYWLFGSYYPLYKQQVQGTTLKDKEKYVKSNDQTDLTRRECWDAGAAGTNPYRANDSVGFFAYSATGGSPVQMKLYLLCASSKGAGWGSEMLNEAVKEAGHGGKEVKIEIESFKSAEGFYNRLELGCHSEDAGKISRATIPAGHTVAPKTHKWYLEEDEKTCYKVDFDCAELDAYQHLVEHGHLIDDGTAHDKYACKPNKNPGTKKLSELVKLHPN